MGALAAARYEWREARCCAATRTRSYRWFLDQLVVVRDDERTRLGYVTRVALGRQASICAVARAVAGQPARDGGAPAVDAFSEDPPMPALLLGETPDDKASADRAAAHVQPRPRVALDGCRARAHASG